MCMTALTDVKANQPAISEVIVLDTVKLEKLSKMRMFDCMEYAHH